MKHNKYAHLHTIGGTLDYHGRGPMTHEAILHTCEEFLVNAISKKWNKVLIITGKGLHSKDGAKVHPLLNNYLSSHPNVIKHLPARRDRGGEGAIEVWLT